MLDSPSELLVLFSSFLPLGGVLCVLLYARASSKVVDTLNLKYDPLLRDRMNQLDISTW